MGKNTYVPKQYLQIKLYELIVAPITAYPIIGTRKYTTYFIKESVIIRGIKYIYTKDVVPFGTVTIYISYLIRLFILHNALPEYFLSSEFCYTNITGAGVFCYGTCIISLLLLIFFASINGV